MKKILLFLFVILITFGLISCQMPTNDSGMNDENQTTQEEPEKAETTTPEQDSEDDLNNGNEGNDDSIGEEAEEEILDLCTTSSFSMLVGETVSLASMIDNNDVWFEIQSSNDVIEVDGNTISAISVGTAILKATSWDDESRTWQCVISVIAEGFTGSALEYKLIGKWYCEDSYIELNADKTGYMKVYLNGSVVQDSSFDWGAYENKYGKYLEIENGADYINKSYTILKVSEVEFRIKGYLGFGMPEETTWVKE